MENFCLKEFKELDSLEAMNLNGGAIHLGAYQADFVKAGIEFFEGFIEGWNSR